MSHIIGIMGPKNSGKNTVAELIKKLELPDFDNVYILSFAGILKDVVAAMFNLDRSMLEGITPEDRIEREKPIESLKSIFGFAPTSRDLLLIIGTGVMRNHLSKDIWTQLLLNKIHSLNKSGHNLFLITDCRFQNETKAIQSFGSHRFWVVLRETPDYMHDALIFNTTKNPIVKLIKWFKIKDIHPTERDWIYPFDRTQIIRNNGTFKELEEKVRNTI